MKMSLDGSGVKKTLSRTKAGIQNFSKSAVASLMQVSAAFAGIGLVQSIIGLGTAAAETASKFRAVFGVATDEMNAKVQELRETIPSTTAEMQNALATFAQMAKAFGLNEGAANSFSVEMVKIAGDIASFNNLPIEDAFTKIRSAISGEFEPMKQLGIVINETRLKQEALNLAIWDGTGQMSAAQKALAVQSIMIRDMGDANGDAALTADSAANRIKFLKKELIETGTKIGTTALPAVLALTDGLSQMLELTRKVTDFAGTKVGEMFFGATDESLALIQKKQDAYDAEQAAIRELTKEGKLYKQGMFESVLWTDGLSEKLEENKRLIKERTNELLAANDELHSQGEEIKKSAEDEIKAAADLGEELEKQIETETDPLRKKALEDRLAAYQKLLIAAGELQSLQGDKPGSTSSGSDGEKKNLLGKIQQIELAIIRAQARGATDAVKSLQDRLEMAKRIVEIMSKGASRAEATAIANAERNKSTKNTASRGNIKTGKITTSKIGDGSMAARMEERERAAGLYLRGNDPMAGRRKPGAATATKAPEKVENYAKSSAENLEIIKQTLTEE